jgi:SPOR domain
MEEKNELNDIILNKGGGSSGSKKLLLAIATLTLILIIVLVIMNSLKSESSENAPKAIVPPVPSAPTEVINDPLFEPVEVIQEGNNTAAASEDLGQIAQKIKQESFDNAPVQNTTPAPAPTPVVQQSAPAVQQKFVPQSVPAAAVKAASKPVATPRAVSTPKEAAPVVNTPTIKTSKPAEVKKTSTAPVAKPVTKTVEKTTDKPVEKTADKSAEKSSTKPTEAPAPKAADAGGTYYIQVGSFTKAPNQALFERLNASGLKYTNVPNGAVTKVMVGPLQGEKATRDALGTVRKNIEAGAFIVKG